MNTDSGRSAPSVFMDSGLPRNDAESRWFSGGARAPLAVIPAKAGIHEHGQRGSGTRGVHGFRLSSE
jgi:hypothetical protein